MNRNDTALCPKCGFESSNLNVCESCGALISKIRTRELNERFEEDSDGFRANHYQRQKMSLTKLVIIVILIIAVAGLAFNSMRKAGVFGQELTGDTVFSTFSETFDSDVLAYTSTPVMVDFYATWCGPCKVLAPELDSVAKEMKGRVKIMKVDVDDNQDLARKYGVQVLPTVIVFKEGKEVDRMIGVLPAAQLKAVVERNS